MPEQKNKKQEKINEEINEELKAQSKTETEQANETLAKDAELPEENKAQASNTQEPVITISKQENEAELLQEQLDVLNDKHLRTLAEYDNYRKRSTKERESIYPQAKADTVEKFLPIIDNFERAVSCECADTEFKKGIEMIFTSFMQVMEELSVTAIGQEGEEFDPSKHNAVMHIEDEAFGQNVIAQVLQKGYKIGERVVRYAMVKVAN